MHAINDPSASLKKIVLRLGDIALGNRRTPPGHVTACMVVATCGEHFVERGEQDALLAVLKELEDGHAWRTHEALAGARIETNVIRHLRSEAYFVLGKRPFLMHAYYTNLRILSVGARSISHHLASHCSISLFLT